MIAKQYPINQSPLFRLVGLGQLEACLNIKLDKLGLLLKQSSYRTWLNEKNRELQHPVGWLGAVHKKLALYLSRIETPDYVFHKKGRSHILNANEHRGFQPVVKTDISSYFPNTSRKMIKRMFIDHFQCSRDIAGILSDVCCYRSEHLPTGSPISGYVAYFANKNLFDKVEELAKERKCLFTLYVDDLTVSGTSATYSLIKEVRLIIKKEGRVSQDKKTHSFSAYAPKTITGVIVRGNQCLLPNQRHKNIHDIKKLIEQTRDISAKKVLVKSLKGHLQAAKQISNANDKVHEDSPMLIYSY